jgi:hypothetical protein
MLQEGAKSDYLPRLSMRPELMIFAKPGRAML